jgi:hypothetical protein
VQAIQDWMGKGGRVIVSGPVGTLSQPDVRSKLRSLLGAYWGFSLQNPSTLAPTSGKNQGWMQQNGLAGIISRRRNHSRWIDKSNRRCRKSTEIPQQCDYRPLSFFRLALGVDTASEPKLDSAWCAATLTRYGGVGTATNPAQRIVRHRMRSQFLAASTPAKPPSPNQQIAVLHFSLSHSNSQTYMATV